MEYHAIGSCFQNSKLGREGAGILMQAFTLRTPQNALTAAKLRLPFSSAGVFSPLHLCFCVPPLLLPSATPRGLSAGFRSSQDKASVALLAKEHFSIVFES